MNIVIIGAGIIGASVFNILTEKNKNYVTIIEQGDIAELGATSVSGGIIRCLDRSIDNIELIRYSLNKYKNFEEYADAKSVFIETGCVYPIHFNQNVNNSHLLIKKLKNRINLEFIDRDKLNLLLPETNWKHYHGAILEKEAGHFCPKFATQSLINFGKKKGGNVLEKTTCTKILYENNKIKGIQTSSGILLADIVVVCSGAWSMKLALVSNISPPKKIRTKSIQMAKFRKNNLSEKNTPIFLDETTGMYGRGSNTNQMMIGIPTKNWDIEPNEVPVTSETTYSKLFTTAQPIWNLSSEDFIHHINMFDAYTEDEKPIVQSSDIEGLYWATGFSGGGFKIAPAIAKKISELIE